MDSAVQCSSDACPPSVVSGASSTTLASQLYVTDQFNCGLPTQHHLSQCPSVEPPHFQLHLPRPPPPQVQPLLGGQNYPQHPGSATPGLGMLYNPALVKREPRITRDVGSTVSGVVGGWHTMSTVGYRDRRLNSTTPVAVSGTLQHQHELSTRNITNNNHDSSTDRKKSRRSGNNIISIFYELF